MGEKYALWYLNKAVIKNKKKRIEMIPSLLLPPPVIIPSAYSTKLENFSHI